MGWDDELTREQKNAASYFGTHACLIGGPGTGKTRVLASRILYLIEERDVNPSAITALTFTRAAATSLPASRIEVEGAIYTGAAVERDGLIITADGPDASRPFGEAIASALEE